MAITALKFGISRRQFVLADTNGIVLTEPDEQAYVLRSWNGHGQRVLISVGVLGIAIALIMET